MQCCSCALIMFFIPRCGIALALNKLSQYLDESQVTPLFLFFVPDALNDRHTDVRRCMLDAALSALNTHGKVTLSSIFLDVVFRQLSFLYSSASHAPSLCVRIT